MNNSGSSDIIFYTTIAVFVVFFMLVIVFGIKEIIKALNEDKLNKAKTVDKAVEKISGQEQMDVLNLYKKEVALLTERVRQLEAKHHNLHRVVVNQRVGVRMFERMNYNLYGDIQIFSDIQNQAALPIQTYSISARNVITEKLVTESAYQKYPSIKRLEYAKP